MSTLLITDQANPLCVIPAHRRARTRVWARLHMSRLDRALAAGACPDIDAALSLRASMLIRNTARRDLAAAINRLLTDARCRPSGPLRSGAPICRRKILDCAPTLRALSRRLVSLEPVEVRGLAMLRLLLTDGAGPIYYRPAVDDLQAALQAVVSALEPALDP